MGSIFKGRITTKWSKTQQKVYSKINAERKKQNKTPLSKAFSGQWWAAKLIKQVVYYSLNAWQMRNNHLHKEKEQEEYYKERNELKQQVSEWYEKQELFEQEDEQFFTISELEKMNEPNGRVRKCNKYQKERTHGQDIRGFYGWLQITNNNNFFLFTSQIIRPGRQCRISVDSLTF